MTESEKKQKKVSEVRPDTVQVSRPKTTPILWLALILPYIAVAGYFWRDSQTIRTPAPSTVATSTSSRPSPATNPAHFLKPGPWGDIEYVPLFIECPEEYLSSTTDSNADRRWFFQNFSRDKVTEYFNSIPELTNEQRQQLAKTKIENGPGGLYLTPPASVVLTLTPEARKIIYRFLTQFPENNAQREAYVFPAANFDEYFKESEVSSTTVELVKKLCYSYGKVLLFADLPYVLDTLPAFEEQQELEKAVSRRSTLLLRLNVSPHSDVNALASYWGRAGTSKDLKPLLHSVSKLPQGERINVALLLPPLPASRLYTYPFPSFSQPENCHWTSFNFFRDPPDNRFSDLKYLREKLDTEFYPMFTDPRYGDLMFLTKPNGDIVHSAVFIADDVVFTKNGGHFSAPWIFMRMPELVDSYSTFVGENEALKVVYYRSKYF